MQKQPKNNEITIAATTRGSLSQWFRKVGAAQKYTK